MPCYLLTWGLGKVGDTPPIEQPDNTFSPAGIQPPTPVCIQASARAVLLTCRLLVAMVVAGAMNHRVPHRPRFSFSRGGDPRRCLVDRASAMRLAIAAHAAKTRGWLRCIDHKSEEAGAFQATRPIAKTYAANVGVWHRPLSASKHQRGPAIAALFVIRGWP